MDKEKQAIKQLKEDIEGYWHEVETSNYKEDKETFTDLAEKYTLILNMLNKQQKEIEEKTTIIFAGAEKVKKLEKELKEKEELLKKHDVYEEVNLIDEYEKVLDKLKKTKEK